jgi:hypothetical protein
MVEILMVAVFAGDAAGRMTGNGSNLPSRTQAASTPNQSPIAAASIDRKSISWTRSPDSSGLEKSSRSPCNPGRVDPLMKEHHAGRAVYGPGRLVLRDPPAELGRGHHERAVEAASRFEVLVERGEGLAWLLQQRCAAPGQYRRGEMATR